MSKFHSTVSRRDFMKGLGLAGAGLGAVAAAAPMFHDLDEVISSPDAFRKLPWYVKEREFFNPTVEIDWAGLEQYDPRNRPSYSAERRAELIDHQNQIAVQNVKDNVPGDTLKDYALFYSTGFGVSVDSYVGPKTFKYTGQTVEELGIEWGGTPEENFRILKVVLTHLGAAEVGAFEVTDKIKKTWPACDSRGRLYSFEEVDEPYSDPDKARVIPNCCRYGVTWVVPQSGISKYRMTNIGALSMYEGYYNSSIIRARLQMFLTRFGFKSLTSSGAGAYNVGIGILAGTGEIGRVDFHVSPSRGTLHRMSDYMLTDLPIAPTKPIDAGIWKFCQTCKKCAETCPGKSIEMGDEPSWEPKTLDNAYGLKSFKNSYIDCQPWRGSPGGMISSSCGICQAICVFTKIKEASIHEVIKGVVAVTPIFNGFFKVMDDFFGYPKNLDPEDFWNQNTDTYIYNGITIT